MSSGASKSIRQLGFEIIRALLGSRRARGVDPCLDGKVVKRRLGGPGLPRGTLGEPAGVVARRSVEPDQQADVTAPPLARIGRYLLCWRRGARVSASTRTLRGYLVRRMVA
jgi:hypothetical protein